MGDTRFPHGPDALLGEIWRRLEAGVDAAAHPFHTACLATCGDAGPSARTVVLRGADRAGWRLECHTDSRSPKVRELERDPRAAWVFYDPADKVQLRAWGLVVLHTGDDLARDHWLATGPGSRRCYLSGGGPGAALDAPGSGLPSGLEERVPSVGESEAGRDNFVVVDCRVERLDWLALDSRGHRRARFDRSGDRWRHAWLTP